MIGYWCECDVPPCAIGCSTDTTEIVVN